MNGLMWLATWEGAGIWPFCLTFVRGGDRDAVFRGFGADPRDAAPRESHEEPDAPVVRVGRSGDWVVALDEIAPAQGTRPEVLRRVSAGTEAVAIYRDIAKLNHEFAYARDGELIAAVTTSVPPHWRGSEPSYLRPLAEELGLTDNADADLSGLEVLLALAEGVFGLSLDETDYCRSWPAAPILPVLDDLPAPSAADLGELEIPADEMRAAEEAARAQPAPVPAITETGPLRSHIRALLDAGLDPAAIVETGGTTTGAFNAVMSGNVPYMPGDIAWRILAIDVPPRTTAG